MKEYKLKFGLQYKNSLWHVVKDFGIEDFSSDCNDQIWMGHLSVEQKQHIHPIINPIEVNYSIDTQLSYKKLCPKCKKKFKVTKEDINHYLVLAKFGIKV